MQSTMLERALFLGFLSVACGVGCADAPGQESTAGSSDGVQALVDDPGRGRPRPERGGMGVQASPCAGPAAVSLLVEGDVSGGVDVGDSGLLFANQTEIFSCSLDGCKGAPRRVASAASVAQLTTAGGSLAFVGRNELGREALYTCTVDGCAPREVASGDRLTTLSSPKFLGPHLFYRGHTFGAPVYGADRLHCASAAATGCDDGASRFGGGAFVADAAKVFYTRLTPFNTKQVAACPLVGPCTPEVLATSTTTDYGALASDGSVLLVARSTSDGTTTTKWIEACPTSGPCTSPVRWTDTAPGSDVSEMVADASGVYWTYGGEQGAIWHCKSGGCPGGAELVVDHQVQPFSLRLHGDYVYWGSKDPAGTVSGQAGVWRALKPGLTL